MTCEVEADGSSNSQKFEVTVAIRAQFESLVG